jgi:hypothetical protein
LHYDRIAIGLARPIEPELVPCMYPEQFYF